MNSLLLLSIQQTLSLIAFGLLAWWHIVPRLARLPVQQALVPLLWVHVFRYTPLTLFAPGQVSPDLPGDVAAAIAYGDLAAALLALVALVALKLRLGVALALVWLFNVVGIADVLQATARGIGAELYRYPLGWNWYILNFYVPMLMVTHVLITVRLLRR